MNTKELFRESSYQKECQATVLAVLDEGVVLDQTVFYPLGGGQPGDSGELLTDSGQKVAVIDTRKSKDHPGAILHKVEGDDHNLSSGDQVTAILNWNNRYRFMRTHTCLHLLGSLLKYPVTGGNISLEKGRLDFDMDVIPDKEKLNQELNELIQQDHVLEYSWITDEEMDANMDLVRTMSVQPPRGAGRVRLVNIPGIDLQPCGGTHVKSTAEIGRVEIGKMEKKGKQNRRINLRLVD